MKITDFLTKKPSSPAKKTPPPRPTVGPTRLPGGKKAKSPKKPAAPKKTKSPAKPKPAAKKMKSPKKPAAAKKPKSPKKPAAKKAKSPKSPQPVDLETLHKMQKYTIMNPSNVRGVKIKNMTDPAYVEEVAPKFTEILKILKKCILPSSRKNLIGKAVIFIKNKKDGVEALATFLTSVGGMTPIIGSANSANVKDGDNLLIMGEVGETSPFHKYAATNQKNTKGMVEKFNEPDNKIGQKYPVMIIHEKYLEGLDLAGVTHIILTQEPGTVGMFDQIIGRGVRSCSHKHYPSNQWNVEIISLVNTFDKPTPDELLIENRLQNTRLVDTVLEYSQTYSLDCNVSKKRYNLICK